MREDQTEAAVIGVLEVRDEREFGVQTLQLIQTLREASQPRTHLLNDSL